MVGVFVRLKLRVLRNSLRGRHLAGMVAGGLAGLVAALVTIGLGLYPFDNPGSSVDVLAAIYGGWLVGWVLAPVATGGGDETLRPEHFALLPLGQARLAVGLLAASFVGVTSVVTLVAFASLPLYGARLGAGPALLGVVFAVLQLVLVVLVYRVVMAALGALLTSRKGKELGILLVALLGLSGVGVNYVLNSLGPALVNGDATEFAGVMKALPSGWGPVAVRSAADGDWAFAGLLLLCLAALIGGLVLVWGALLSRSTTATRFRGAARTGGQTRTRRTLLPDTPVGAVAAKELHTWWRDARRRVALLSTVIIGLVVTVVPSLSDPGEYAGAVLPFLGVVIVGFAVMQAGNLYGFDGSALWHTLVIPHAARPDVRGRQLAWALLVGPPGLLLALVLPAVTGHTWTYPWVLALVPALLGTGAGLMLLQSVYLAFPLPDPRRNSNPFSSGGRPGCARSVLILALALLLVVGGLPPAALLLTGTIADQPVLEWLAIPVGVLTGGLLAWWWGRIAMNRLAEHGPELFATVSKER